jgi:hypothetical protein
MSNTDAKRKILVIEREPLVGEFYSRLFSDEFGATHDAVAVNYLIGRY